jgi:hypothetical protein
LVDRVENRSPDKARARVSKGVDAERSRDLNGVLGLLQFRKSRRRPDSAKQTSGTNLPSTGTFAICVNPEALHATSRFPESGLN